MIKFHNADIDVMDLSTKIPDLKGFHDGFTAGDYGYLVPNADQASSKNVGVGKLVRFDLATFSIIKVIDLFSLDTDLVYFTGGFVSGDYGYLVPDNGGWYDDFGNELNTTRRNGKVVRFDLATFSFVDLLDLSGVNVHTDLNGFYGGFAAGDYGYLVPWFATDDTGAGNYSSKLVRFPLVAFDTVEVLDLSTVNGHTDLKGFKGGFTSGNYGYLVPYFNGDYLLDEDSEGNLTIIKTGIASKVVRFNIENFNSVSVEVLDLSGVNGHTDLNGFIGGFAAGDYGYLVPHYGPPDYSRGGKVVRFDLATFNNVDVLDVPNVVGDANLVGFRGGFAYGQYGYIVPADSSQVGGPLANRTKVVRFPLVDFNTAEVLYANIPNDTNDFYGFTGGFASRGYGYLVPGMKEANGTYGNTPHTNVVRFKLEPNVQRPGEIIRAINSPSRDIKYQGFYNGGRLENIPATKITAGPGKNRYAIRSLGNIRYNTDNHYIEVIQYNPITNTDEWMNLITTAADSITDTTADTTADTSVNTICFITENDNQENLLKISSTTIDDINNNELYLSYKNNRKVIFKNDRINVQSDDRLKHNEEVIPNSLDLIEKLKPYKYQKTDKMYDASYNGIVHDKWLWEIGLIAQDVSTIPYFNFMVNQMPKDGRYTLSYLNLIGLLVQGTKDLYDENKSLKKDIETCKKDTRDVSGSVVVTIQELNNKIEELKSRVLALKK